MKAINIKNLFASISEPVCPVCEGPLKTLKLASACEHAGENGSIRLLAESMNYYSDDHDAGDHVEGKMMLCLDCHEVFFMYEVQDNRTCKSCKHCKVLPNNGYGISYRCEWYNCGLNEGRNGCNRHHCNHINDAERPEIPDFAICRICDHCEKQGEDFLCSASQRYLHTENMDDHAQTCHAFAPSYFQYKKYRLEKDADATLFDDSIHIPAYDHMINEENKRAEAGAHLGWNDHNIPMRFAVSMYNNDPTKQIIYAAYEGVWFFDKIIPKEDLTNLDTLKRYVALCTNGSHNEFHNEVICKFKDFVEKQLHQDILDFLKKF